LPATEHATMTCRRCETQFTPVNARGPKSAYCSARCRGQSRIRVRIPSGDSTKPVGVKCKSCETIIVQKRGRGRAAAFCSVKCRSQNGPLIVRPTRECHVCRELFTPKDSRCSATTCSLRCRRRLLNRIRNRQREVSGRRQAIGPKIRAAVFERDGWMCGICYKPIDRNIEWPDPMSAELDHRKPVEDGGTDEPENLQATHRCCNADKAIEAARLKTDERSSPKADEAEATAGESWPTQSKLV
jgi:hypothetical protein